MSTGNPVPCNLSFKERVSLTGQKVTISQSPTDNQINTTGNKNDRIPGIHPRLSYGYILVIAATSIMILFFGTSTSFGVFFKPVQTEFGWNRAITSGAFSLSLILQGSLGVIMGRLTDRFGPRMVITLCGSLLSLGYLLMSQMTSIGQFYLFYVVIGIGMSGANVSLVSTVARWFVKRRGVMTGVVMAGGGIGSLIAPPIATWLIRSYDWRTSYIVLGTFIFAVVLFAAQFIRRDPPQPGQLPYGYNQGEEPRLELVSKGLSHIEAVHTRQFWIVFAIYFSLGFCAYVIMVHIVPYVTDIGISPVDAARILATIGGGAIAGRIVMGGLGDCIGNRQAFIMSFTLMSIALFWLILVKEKWMLYVFASFHGFAWGAGALGSPLVAELFGLRSHGTNMGVINFGYSAGASVGSFMAGYMFDVADSYQPVFVVTMFIALIALMSSVFLKPISFKVTGQDGREERGP